MTSEYPPTQPQDVELPPSSGGEPSGELTRVLAAFDQSMETIRSAVVGSPPFCLRHIASTLAARDVGRDCLEREQVRARAQIASPMALEIASPKALLTPRLPRARAGGDLRRRRGDRRVHRSLGRRRRCSGGGRCANGSRVTIACGRWRGPAPSRALSGGQDSSRFGTCRGGGARALRLSGGRGTGSHELPNMAALSASLSAPLSASECPPDCAPHQVPHVALIATDDLPDCAPHQVAQRCLTRNKMGAASANRLLRMELVRGYKEKIQAELAAAATDCH